MLQKLMKNKKVRFNSPFFLGLLILFIFVVAFYIGYSFNAPVHSDDFLNIQYDLKSQNILTLNNINEVRALCNCDSCDGCGSRFVISRPDNKIFYGIKR